MSTKRIFITRSVSTSSPLLAIGPTFTISGESLLRFDSVEIDDRWKACDWLFFYSRRGVQCFCDQAQPLAHQKIGCIGPQTAASFERRNGQSVELIGNGIGHTTAQSLQQGLTPTETIAFIRAANSLKSVQVHLDQRQVIDVICYNNDQRDEISLQPCDIAVLTSPLNAMAWVSNYQAPISAVTIIAIGKSTSHLLNGLSLAHQVSLEPSEIGIVNTIKELSSR